MTDFWTWTSAQVIKSALFLPSLEVTLTYVTWTRETHFTNSTAHLGCQIALLGLPVITMDCLIELMTCAKVEATLQVFLIWLTGLELRLKPIVDLNKITKSYDESRFAYCTRRIFPISKKFYQNNLIRHDIGVGKKCSSINLWLGKLFIYNLENFSSIIWKTFLGKIFGKVLKTRKVQSVIVSSKQPLKTSLYAPPLDYY